MAWFNRHRLDLWAQTFAGSAVSAAATNFLARTSGLNAAHTAAYTTLLNGLTTDGFFDATGNSIKLDGLYVFATADTTTALLNLVSASFTATVSGTPTFTVDQGYSGSLNNYIDSNFSPANNGITYLRNSGSLFAWSNTNNVQSNGLFVGDGSNISFLDPQDSAGTAFGQINESIQAFDLFGTVSNSLGLYCANRSASNASQLYKNGSSIATNATASVAPAVATFTFFRSAALGWTGIILCGGFGGSLSATDNSNLYARLHVYLQTIAGIP